MAQTGFEVFLILCIYIFFNLYLFCLFLSLFLFCFVSGSILSPFLKVTCIIKVTRCAQPR